MKKYDQYDIFTVTAMIPQTKNYIKETKKVIAIGTYGYAGETTPAFYERFGKYSINVQNSKKGASYTFTSSNKKVATVKTSKTTGYLTGLKAGTYTVTVKETYKKKTKTLGKIKVKVHDNGLQKETVTLPVGGDLNLQDLLKYYNGGWTVTWDEEDILEPGEPDWNGNPTVRAIKPGTANLKYYYCFEEGKLAQQIGVCTVTVVDVKVTDIQFEEEVVNVCEDDQGYDPLNYKYTLVTDPEDFYYNGDVTFTSSDEKVVSISSEGTCQIEGVGTADVTITAGDVSKTVTVNVLTSEEYYNLDDVEEDW